MYRSSWRRIFLVYLILSVLCLCFILLSKTRGVYLIKDVGSTVLYPFRFILRHTGQGISSLVHPSSKDSKNLEVEVEKLKAELEGLRQKMLNLNALQEDNDRLRKLLDLKKTVGYDGIAAEVIGRDFAFGYSYLTLNKGRMDGVINGLPIVTFLGMEKAVVGIVTEAGLMTSKIRTFKSELFDVGVYFSRTNVQAVAEGLGGTTNDIQVLYVDKSEPLDEGDLVYTSKDSSIFPPNLLLGKVDSIDNTKKTATTYQIYLIPSVPLNKLREVLILRPQIAQS